MVKKPTRLRFTEDDLSDTRVKSAYEKAQKQTDKAERAVERITSGKNHYKLRDEASISANRKEKLRFIVLAGIIPRQNLFLYCMVRMVCGIK